MRIQFRNIPKIKKKSAIRIFREAAEFYAQLLMGPRLSDKIYLRVQFIDELEKKEGIGGDCIWDDDNIRPREFTIRLDSSNDIGFMLRSFAHEMVHVKQFAKSELKDLSKQQSLCKFYGKLYNTDDVNYWDYPWEIEAHGREEGLFVRFAEYLGLSEKDLFK